MFRTPYERYLANETLTILINKSPIPLQEVSEEVIDKMIEKFRLRENLTRLSFDREIDRYWIKVLQSIKKERRKLKLQKICLSQETK